MSEENFENFDNILEQETEKAISEDPYSLRNSPIPNIDDISRKFKTEDEMNHFINSNLNEKEKQQVTKIAWQVTNEIEKGYPDKIKSDDDRKNIWMESVRQVLLKGMNSGGRKRRKKTSVPKRYVPKQLSKKDKEKQKKELKKSRKAYKKGKYYTRKKMKSFKSKVSPHILKARKLYKIEKIRPTKELAKKCGCKVEGLRKIVKKGQGAYFSSGSRPNQTGHSWGYARMASAITGGKAAGVDYNILEKYCNKNSKALKLAKKMIGKGTRRVKQVQIGGGKMKESVVGFKKGPFPKKYTAIIRNNSTKKTRKIHFGDRRYQQYKDRTPLKLYEKNNHNTRKRMQNYFNRHSGTKKRQEAIDKEKKKSGGIYNAKILSHIYLW